MLLLVQNKPPTLLSMRRQHCVRYLVYSLRLERLHPCKLGKAEAITKTQARRPRYRMTGITTLTGRFSSAVGTTHDASKVIPCIVILLLAAKPPSPEVVHDKAPVPPGSVFLYDHIDPSWPMMFRIASCCQLPASRPTPGLHARKGCTCGKKL